jgi:isoleucyl-tRNA synthetase
LVSNTAIAVHPEVEYVVLNVQVEEQEDEVLVVAKALMESVKGEKKILQTLLGKELEKTTYQRPFDYVEIPEAHYIVLATYVTT